ncbi:hypothetical protein E2562_017543 [Oryza meyeriana var. granulata]|uniref:Uncharacterized protein n=1 Tax=Oryza meyeriana var. granulata TaxID=110450 RepID=A0A6G1C7D8_9ORYZ|nr:hypothetical protein E2562_017543 [Oryza meyeriana var. granulata]
MGSVLLPTLRRKREVDAAIRDTLDKYSIAAVTWTPDHTKWIGSFSSKQDFIDVVEAIFRGAMKGKLIVSCPLPPERIPRFQLLFKDMTELYEAIFRQMSL